MPAEKSNVKAAAQIPVRKGCGKTGRKIRFTRQRNRYFKPRKAVKANTSKPSKPTYA